jgi:phosphate/sulfate permease
MFTYIVPIIAVLIALITFAVNRWQLNKQEKRIYAKEVEFGKSLEKSRKELEKAEERIKRLLDSVKENNDTSTTDT